MMLQRSLKLTGLVVLIGATAAGAGMAMLARSAPEDAARTAAGDADDTRYRVMMTGGATIEVVAVSSVPTGPDTWWKPDGSRLAEAPVDAIAPSIGAQDGEVARVVLVRASGLKKDDNFRWHPTAFVSSWGGRPKKNGKDVAGLEYYETTFRRETASCGVQAKVAAGGWKTEVTNDGQGGVGMFVNGHKFAFGKARAYSWHGRPMTVFAVAHNFFGQDRRLVAIDREGKPHPAVAYSAGSDGDPKWVIDLIDGEFMLPPDRIQEYHVQFRPFEQLEIKDIALNPRPAR